MLKIMMVLASNGSNVGGMEKQLALQANTLGQVRNIEIHVLAHPNYRALFESPCTFSPMPMHLGRRNPILLRKLVSKVRGHDPNLIHVHGNKAANLLYSTRWFIGKCKKVGTVHGTKKPNRALAALDRRLAVSKGVEHALLPLDSSVIGNAVAPYAGRSITKAMLCKRFDMDTKLPLLIAAGRLVPVKGYDSLMTAIQQVDCNLIVFGEGPEESHLERLQSKRVKLAGHEPNVRQFFGAADALMINSSREGMSMSMLEALQQELPVLSTAVSGSAEFLPPSCQLNYQHPSELSRVLAEKVGILDQLSVDLREAYDRINKLYTAEALVTRLVDHYHELLAIPDTTAPKNRNFES